MVTNRAKHYINSLLWSDIKFWKRFMTNLEFFLLELHYIVELHIRDSLSSGTILWKIFSKLTLHLIKNIIFCIYFWHEMYFTRLLFPQDFLTIQYLALFSHFGILSIGLWKRFFKAKGTAIHGKVITSKQWIYSLTHFL